MLSPKLLASVPHDNRTAMLDLVGTLELYFRGLATAAANAGKTFRLYPIGTPGGQDWLLAVQSQFVAAASALGIAAPPDLSSYDLADESDWASWTFSLSNSLEALRVAAGVA